MNILEPTLLLILVLLTWTHAGYYLTVTWLARARRLPVRSDVDFRPSVAVIVVAFNEEKSIAEKIRNFAALRYPHELLSMVVVSDASRDDTDRIVHAIDDPRVTFLRIDGRVGKTQCQNAGIAVATSDVIVLSDANSIYSPNAIPRLVRALADPAVGIVTGRLIYRAESRSLWRRGVEAARHCSGEGFYWRLETRLKALESRLGSVIPGVGSIYAMRRQQYRPLPPDLQSDFATPLHMIRRGYRVVYEPRACAYEPLPPDDGKGPARRVRSVARAVHTLASQRQLWSLLAPWRHGFFAVQLWSHKILRWLTAPMLIAALLLTVALFGAGWQYTVLLAVQLTVYSLAAVAYCCPATRLRQLAPPLYYLRFFLTSAGRMFRGLVTGLLHEPIVTWTPIR